jgi:hypothetical protein
VLLRLSRHPAGYGANRRFVIPAKAGIQELNELDPGFRRGDEYCNGSQKVSGLRVGNQFVDTILVPG